MAAPAHCAVRIPQAFPKMREGCERAQQSVPMPRPSGFGNSSADDQISPPSQFAKTIHCLAVRFGRNNLEAPRAQQTFCCTADCGVIIDHHDKLAGVCRAHHHPLDSELPTISLERCLAEDVQKYRISLAAAPIN